MRAQIGEFSFVLEQVGRDAGLTPLDLGDDGVQAFLAASVLLMVLTPVLAPVGAAVGRRVARGGTSPASPSARASTEPEELEDHVIVAGYGDAARRLVPELRAANIPFVVTTLNPQGAMYAETLGVPVLLGDSSKSHALERAGVRRARILVVADDEAEIAKRIVEVAEELNPDLEAIVRLDHDEEADELAHSGAELVVTGPSASAGALGDAVVREYYGGADLDGAREAPPVDTRRVVRFDPAPTPCRHLDHIGPVLPSAPGCEECLQLGDTWVHLRICLTCGHVGCCDDSQHRHARRHASELHPVARSLEHDERWAWCYPEEIELEPR
jgi:CPA2 family monovalent cation:H+ antiporter-2